MDNMAGVRMAVVPVGLGDGQHAEDEVGVLAAVPLDWGDNVASFRHDVVVLEPPDGDILWVEPFDQASNAHIRITRSQLFVVGAEEVNMGTGGLALL